MAGFDWDNRNEGIEELSARVAELATRLEDIWRALTDRRVGDSAPSGASGRSSVETFLGMNFESWARRTGFHVARGDGWEPLERTLRSTLEREVGKRWEKLLVRSMGASVLTSFAGGAGVALIDSLFSAASRALKPRRLNLPELAHLPESAFPDAASYRQVLPRGRERTSAHALETRRTSSLELTPVAQAIETTLAERLRRELP